MTAFEAFDNLQEADDIWQIELEFVFGVCASDMRYQPEGRGEPGTKLNAAWKAREAALRAYHAAVTAAVGVD